MKRLGPGVYSDGAELHLVVTELLDAAGYPDTEANVQAVVHAALERFDTLDIPIEFTP
jgi:hypothetical protein